ncbi:MAG: hypothetical protein CMJ32_09515 [Phycisphaerae bacterium]|nr:hypothetical protein [Phycisphaerae bacterium]
MDKKPRLNPPSILVALMVGLIIAVIIWAIDQDQVDVDRVFSTDPQTARAERLRLLQLPEPSTWIDRNRHAIKVQLGTASDDTLVEYVEVVEPHGGWDWSWPEPLQARLIDTWTRRGDLSGHLLAVDLLMSRPRDSSYTPTASIIDRMLQEPDPVLRSLVIDLAIAQLEPRQLRQVDTTMLRPGLAERIRLASGILDEMDWVDPSSSPDWPAGDPGDASYAMALHAEATLQDKPGSRLVSDWLESDQVNLQRAGAILALLSGHVDRLERAMQGTTGSSVSSFQRLVLSLAGRAGPGDPDPGELAHRLLHRGGGRMDPDVVMVLLCSGHDEALAFLTRLPADLETTGDHEDLDEQIQWRLRLTRRFLPQLLGCLGDEALSSAEEAVIAMERLDVCRLLQSRRLDFDPSARRFIWSVPDAGSDRD